MNTKPNPLAVMERDAIQAVQYRVMIGENVMGHATSSDDARAAVAELVEKARELAKLCDEASSEGRFADGIGSELTALEDVQAALARFEVQS
jgi:hypothetical protein